MYGSLLNLILNFSTNLAHTVAHNDAFQNFQYVLKSTTQYQYLSIKKFAKNCIGIWKKNVSQVRFEPPSLETA